MMFSLILDMDTGGIKDCAIFFMGQTIIALMSIILLPVLKRIVASIVFLEVGKTGNNTSFRVMKLAISAVEETTQGEWNMSNL